MSVATSALPSVRLEINQGGRSVPYLFDQVDFLIGAVAGCDLRLPGAELPAVLCLLARHPDGVKLRRLAPTQVLLLNGEAVSRADLNDGDRLTVGAVDIFVRLEKPAAAQVAPVREAPAKPAVDVERLRADLAERDARLRVIQTTLEQERNAYREQKSAWDAERSTLQQPTHEQMSDDLLARELKVGKAEAEWTKRSQALDARAAEIEKQKQEIATVRQELNDIRQQLYDRYQERRDRLAGLQESVDRAAKKVQETKRGVEQERMAFAQQRADVERRDVELRALETEVESDCESLEASRKRWQAEQRELETALAAKVADLKAREDRLASQTQTLEARERQYQADVVRLDRQTGDVEGRERQLAERAAQLESQRQQLQSDAAELEAQAHEVDVMRAAAVAESARLVEQKLEQDVVQRQLDQRAAALEGQQAALTTLRGKLERMRDDFRKHDQALEEQRLAHEDALRRTAEKQQQLHEQEADLKAQAQTLAAEKQQFVERQSTLAAALAKLEDAQDRLADQDNVLRTRSQDLDRKAALVAEQEALLAGRLDQVAEAQARLDAERQTLRERTASLAETEKAREALQEQLRRRSEDLAAKQKQLHEQLEQTTAKQASLKAREEEMFADLETARVAFEAEKRVVDEQTEQLELRRQEMIQLDELQRNRLQEITDKARALAEQERGLSEQQAKHQDYWRTQQELLRQDRDGLEEACRQAQEMKLELPELELRAGTAVDRLSHAREQLRDQLAEARTFVQQTRDEFEAAEERLRHDESEFAQQQGDFRRLRDEHRVALASFRQQIVDWQAQIEDVQRLLKNDDKLVVTNPARFEQATRERAVESVILDSQKETVAGQPHEHDRQVGDLRDWYRRKMRELAGGPAEAELADVTAAQLDGDDALLPPTERDILSITGPVDPADRGLADRLVQQQLIDESAVHSLLVEARRQRRSLKQILVAGGAVTPYQLALLEAGQTSSLVVGPFRVVDRLRQTPHETIYRVFDPRRGQECLLRRLSEDAALDAASADEYRQRFAQLIVPDVHVAGVLEVCEIDGRPAALQEWLVGLPSSDWPPLAAAPGVCYRLLTQAALGFAALKKHGLTHGRFGEQHLLLTPQGVLKLCGANEPAWLHGGAAPVGDDLQRLGKIVSGWCTPSGVRKGPKAKPLPQRMMAILERLQADGLQGYLNVQTLLDDLDQVSADVPSNPEAWDRLLRYVRDHAQPEAMLRQSA